MTSTPTNLLEELEPVVAENLDRHLSIAQEWHPHDYIPWSQGRDFAFLGGEDWAPSSHSSPRRPRPRCSPTSLTEDNLPSTTARSRPASAATGAAWGTWVGRLDRAGEPARRRDARLPRRHRGVDPVELERARMDYMTSGYDSGEMSPRGGGRMSFQELATGSRTATPARSPATRSRTGCSPGSPRTRPPDDLDRNICLRGAGDRARPTMQVIAKEVIGFEMPGATMAGFRRSSMMIAKAGYLRPAPPSRRRDHAGAAQHWRVLDRTDFGLEGEQAREQLAVFLEGRRPGDHVLDRRAEARRGWPRATTGCSRTSSRPNATSRSPRCAHPTVVQVREECSSASSS